MALLPSTALFSSNPDKAWVEKFFLIYSPVWMLQMAVMMFTGWDKSFNDIQLLLQATLLAAPCLLVPAWLHNRYSPDIHWKDSYWLKVNLYLFVFGFFGNYFGSEYFFDVLGMVYNYPNATTNLDASLVGNGTQKVPLIMYFYTHAYFMTYHATANIALRLLRHSGLPVQFLLFPVSVFVIGYAWAWMETKAMANPLIASSFYYEKKDIMLAYGSAIYATYFVASFPIYYFIDESVDRRWSLPIVFAAACTASMLTFYMLDLSAHWVGNIYE